MAGKKVVVKKRIRSVAITVTGRNAEDAAQLTAQAVDLARTLAMANDADGAEVVIVGLNAKATIGVTYKAGAR